MKKLTIITIILFLYQTAVVSQTLNLGILTSFEGFSGRGGVANTGGTVNGDVGTHSGTISGGYSGVMYNADTVTDQAIFDLMKTFIHLNDLFVDFPSTHAPAFGSGETIPPGAYSIVGAGTLGGALTLDGQGDPDAFFIIKFGGAFTIAASATVTLINGAQSCNVFWLAGDAISVAANANIKGTLFSKIGAVGIGEGVILEGRMLTMDGAITFGIDAIASPPPGTTTIPIFCESICTPASDVDVLGVVSNFALYTNLGTVSNTSISGINGNIGTDVGSISGYATSIHIGTEEVANTYTAQAHLDLDNAYTALMALPVTGTHGSVFGLGETLLPGVYDMAAGSIGGTITLDAGGDADAIFVMRFAGALTIGTTSKIILANGTKHCNVFWIGGAGIASGAISIGANSVLKGTFLSHNGACTSATGLFLAGRLLSTDGAVTTDAGIIYNVPECVTSTPLPPSTLPIELLKFTAIAKDLHIQLDWSTATENNNDYFTIERSKNAVNWETVAIINGAGNSNQLLHYNLIDDQPYLNDSYYRLKQTDFDNNYTYSDIKVIKINSSQSDIIIYPNPTNGQVTIQGNKEELKNLKIYNTLGQDLTTLVDIISINEMKKTIDLTSLLKGIYILKTKTSANTVYIK